MSFLEIAQSIGKLVEEKNKAYGDSFEKSGEILKILYPNGIQPEQYQDALGIVRVIDKLFRIATAKDAFGESPWRDIAGYGILGAAKNIGPLEEAAMADPLYGKPSTCFVVSEPNDKISTMCEHCKHPSHFGYRCNESVKLSDVYTDRCTCERFLSGHEAAT